jgi:thioester reductase-like protein
MRPPVFMTGATGFLGMEVLARLLEAGDREVVCLVRAADRGAAEARLNGVLETLWTDPAPYRGRVRAVAGDLTTPGLGMDIVERTSLAEEVGTVLHCAASISFDLPLEEARQINVEGTREMIGFAREAKALGRLERFLHVSTAYVAGAYPGTFREHQLVAGQEFRNTYEQTKWEAEQVVAEADDLSPAVVRPSIVMGESDSGWTPAFNVLYWPLRAFSRGLFDTVPALAGGRVDVVSVDYVADAILALSQAPGGDGATYHLTAGDEASTVGELIDLAAESFDRRPPVSVPPVLYRRLVHPLAVRASDGRRRRMLQRSEAYFPYFAVDTVFDDTATRAALAPERVRRAPLWSYFDQLVDFAVRADWGRRPVTRREAREVLSR